MMYNFLFEKVARFFKPFEEITILEIGVGRCAGSTRGFLNGLALRKRKWGGRFYSIDINKHCRVPDLSITPKRHAKRLGIEDLYTFIEGDSKEVDWDKEIDVLFIDGDHSYEVVKADFEKYVPFVKENGLIFMHDVSVRNYGVKEFWKEIKYPKVMFVLEKCGLGIVTKTNKKNNEEKTS